MTLFLNIIIFCLGLAIGSFLNVCIYRMPQDLSIVKPGSFCPACKTPIPWRYNIPLIGFLWLRGKCAHCHQPISWRYFWVELTSELLWLLLWQTQGFSWGFLISVIFLSAMIVVTITDVETGLIPDRVAIPGMVLGLVLSVVNHEGFPQGLWYHKILASAAGLLGGGAFLFVTGWIGNVLFRKESMGGGDVKLLAMMGAFFGFYKAFWVFILAPFIALPFALWQRIVHKEETIPYGPFLVFWGVLLFTQGDWILKLISQWYGV